MKFLHVPFQPLELIPRRHAQICRIRLICSIGARALPGERRACVVFQRSSRCNTSAYWLSEPLGNKGAMRTMCKPPLAVEPFNDRRDRREREVRSGQGLANDPILSKPLRPGADEDACAMCRNRSYQRIGTRVSNSWCQLITTSICALGTPGLEPTSTG